MPFQIVDQAAAEARAEACSGVHYSFEKLDRVTCSTVMGRIDLLIDPKRYRNELVSFGVDEEALQLARTQISDATDLDDGDTIVASATAESAQHVSLTTASTALASQARFDRLNEKRDAGKRKAAEKRKK